MMTTNRADHARPLHSEQPWFVLSAARHYDLILSRNPAISHFYGFEADQSQGLTFAVPDGCIDILFDCDARHAKVCGTTLAARSAQLTHQHRYFGVRFAPGVMPDVLNVGAAELVDTEIDLQELVPNSTALLDKICSLSNAHDQASLFERFINGHRHRRIAPATEHALALIHRHQGNILIRELEQQTGYSIRTLQRQFSTDLGLSPKVFSRIVRCQQALHDMHHQPQIVFADLAFERGFSDQSHFLREFKKFANATPAQYLNTIQHQGYQARIRQMPVHNSRFTSAIIA